MKGIEPSWRTMSWARSERGNSSGCCTDLATQAASVEMNWQGVSPNSNRVIANEFRFQSIPVQTRTPEEEVTRRALAAQSRVQRRQFLRARQELVGAALERSTIGAGAKEAMYTTNILITKDQSDAASLLASSSSTCAHISWGQNHSA